LAWNVLMFLVIFFSFIEIPVTLMVIDSYAEVYQ
jgi:hypothetical protein